MPRIPQLVQHMPAPVGIRPRTIPWYLAGGAPMPVAAYQPKGAASLAASYTNLANPGTYDAAPGVAPTWATGTGWTFNGTTQYLTTGIILPTNQHTLIAQFANGDVSASDRSIIGANDPGGTFLHLLRSASTFSNHRYRNGTAALGVAPNLSSGNMAYSGSAAYLNGASDGTILGLTGIAGTQLYIGALNSAPTPNQFFSGDIIAIAIYSTTLTAPQVAAVSTAMAAL